MQFTKTFFKHSHVFKEIFQTPFTLFLHFHRHSNGSFKKSGIYILPRIYFTTSFV